MIATHRGPGVRHRLALLTALLGVHGATLPAAAQTVDRLEELLALSLRELLQVKVVSALKQAERIALVPATVRIITAEQIRRRGYLTLQDALADLPGVQERDIVGFNSYLFLRGVPSQNNKILLLVDGIQVNELNSGGFYAGRHFNLAAVERIEVVYGPASVLYGSNAISGIVNIITRAPPPQPGREGEVALVAGQYDTAGAHFRFAATSAASGLAFALAGMWSRSDRANLRGARGDSNWSDRLDTSERGTTLDARLRYKSLQAGAAIQDRRASRGTVNVSSDGRFRDHGVPWHIRFTNLWASWERQWQEGLSLRALAYLRETTVLPDSVSFIEERSPTSAGKQVRVFRPAHQLGQETQLIWSPSPVLNVAAGLILERDTLSERFATAESASADERAPRPPRPAKVTTDLLSLFAQARVSVAPPLHLYAGLRWDHSDTYGQVTTPRLALVYSLPRTTAKLLYSEAFRAPKQWDFTDGAGNPGLKPERMHSLEAAMELLLSSHLRWETSLYRNRLAGLLTRVPWEGSWRWDNAGWVNTWGGESVLEWHWPRLTASLSYALANSRDEQRQAVPEIAKHGAAAAVAYRFSPRWEAEVRARYLGARDSPEIIPATGNRRISAALVVDATLTATFAPHLFVQFAVDNLTDEVYFHTSNLPPSRFRQPQRSVRLKVGHAFP